MNILIISPEPWDTNQVSKHHYARTLAKRGHRVFFLDPPDDSSSGIHIEPIPGEHGALLRVHGPRVAPGLRFMPKSLRQTLERRWLERVEKAAGTYINIVWLFENSRFFDMAFAGDRMKIYHQVDLNQDFHLADAAASADVCFAVSDIVLQRITKHASVAHKIPHGLLGIDLDATVAPSPLIRAGRPAAAYVGNLDIAYLDLNLLEKVIAGSPEVDFHMIGSFDSAGEFHGRFCDVPNVTLRGHLPSAALPSALAVMDVLMIVYDTARHGQQLANPHKLMEYLGSGNVTVATWTEEYKALAGGPVVMVEDPRDYPAAFRAVIAELGRWNAPELRAQRIAFARDNTYDRQVDRISAALTECPAIRARFGEICL